MKTKWIFAFFPKETVFWGTTIDGKKVEMLIRANTLCKIQEVDHGGKGIRGKEAVSDRQVESSSSQHSPKSDR